MTPFPSDIEYAERGEGPAVLFIPGSFGAGAGWRPVIERLGAGFRVVTTSLLGYGATAERRPPVDANMAQQVEALDAVFDRIGAPAHVVGHSFGGLSALAHALCGRHAAASLTLIEANPFPILSAAGERTLHDLFGAMTRVYFAAFEAGEPDAARHCIDFYGGAGAFDSFPQRVRDYVVATTATNIRDWSAAASFAPALADFSAISAPALVIRGADGHPAMRRIAELLAECLPRASLATIDGGRHFLPASHPAELAALIAAHVRAARA